MDARRTQFVAGQYPRAPMGTEGEHTARAYWVVEPGRGELRTEELTWPVEGEPSVRVKTLFTGLSRGTERLVHRGGVPPSERERMRAPFQAGDFPFPVKYGYAAVGTVEDGPAGLVGQPVFCLHPHQDHFVVPVRAVRVVPAGVPARRAVLAANMETAVNAVWDGGVSVGDRVAVVGCGVVGALVAYLCARIPGTSVAAVDLDPGRRGLAEALGASFGPPESAADVVFHATGSADGLATALDLAGKEARVVDLSWYGDRRVSVPLGEAFHAGRLSIVSSQVGSIPPLRTPRWDFGRRLDAALGLLLDPTLDALLSADVPFGEIAGRMPALLEDPATLCATFRHG